MPQQGRSGRLDPAVGTARAAFAAALAEHLPGADIAPTGRARREPGAKPRLVLVACSGGPDSLALAAVAAHFARRGDLRAGAVVVDHGLQEGSAEVAGRAAEQCRALGLDPVLVRRAEPAAAHHGPEMAARLARYAVFEKACAELAAAGNPAAAVLLGHTLDDQAETVLLGLARGSGTRSLAGMPPARPLAASAGTEGAAPDASEGPLVLRPLLSLRREDLARVCAAEGLEPWQDPTNADTSLRRNRVRHAVLPYLEDELGPGIAAALARTAAVLGPDAELIEELAAAGLAAARTDPALYREPGTVRTDVAAERHEGSVHRPSPHLAGRDAGTEQVVVGALDQQVLRTQHPAVRRRVLARAVTEAGGEAPAAERLAALDAFALGHGSAGPVQMAGRVAVWRRRPRVDDAARPHASVPPGTEASGRPAGRPGALVLVRT